MVEEVLPDVPYAQLVLTIPKMLRPSFLWDRKLYGDLSWFSGKWSAATFRM